MIKLSSYVKLLLMEEKMDINMANQIFASLGYPNASNMSKNELRNAWKELSAKHHPDKGGNVETMQNINAAYDFLKTEPQKTMPSYNNFGVPPWETDERAAFNVENPQRGHIGYYKKKAWEISGKPASIKDNIYTFYNWDGYYFRNSFSVFTINDPNVWFEISNMLIEWDNFHRSVAVFVRQHEETDTLYLINHRGKKIIPPKKYEYEIGCNPGNDRYFTDKLRKEL